jgi:hypothetical protein
MADHRINDDDAVQPTEIEHRCEEMFDGNRLIQRYNYIVYHFENGGRYSWARAYFDDAGTVALYGPFHSRATKNPIAGGAMDDDVLAYLRRWFRKIERLGSGGYVTVR